MWYNTDYIFQTKKTKRSWGWISLLLLFGCSVVLFLMNLMLQTNPLKETFSYFLLTPRLFLLNWFPVFWMLFLLYALSGKIKFAIPASTLFFFTLLLANRLKIEARNEPLFFSDLRMLKEVGVVLFHSISWGFFCIGLLFFLLLIFSFYKVSKNWEETRIGIPLRLVMLSLCIAAAYFLQTYYSNKDLRFTDKETIEYSDSVIYFNRFGFVYRFIANARTYSDVYKPPFYEKNKMTALDTDGAERRHREKRKWTDQKKADIICILSESFCDIPDLPFFRFKEEGYPLNNYSKVKQESILHGYLDVSGFGGGTANTEFDILTACCSNSADTESLYPYRAIRQDIASVPRVLRSIGYTANAIQPMQDWYYNVRNVYRYFGFKQCRFLKDFEGKPLRGGYMNEKDTIQRVIDDYEAHIQSHDSVHPIFNYCVTIQNHAYYKYSKYPNETVPVLFDKKWLSSKGVESLATYFHGLRDVDRELGRLVEYLKNVNRPVVLVYYGDHLPHLPPEPELLKSIGYLKSDDDGKKYQPPFLIWANEEGKKLLVNKTPVMPKNGVISSSYLTPLVFEMLGYQGVSNFFDFVNEMRRRGAHDVIRPEHTRKLYRDPEKYRFENKGELSPDELDFMTYVAWQYHILHTKYEEK